MWRHGNFPFSRSFSEGPHPPKPHPQLALLISLWPGLHLRRGHESDLGRVWDSGLPGTAPLPLAVSHSSFCGVGCFCGFFQTSIMTCDQGYDSLRCPPQSAMTGRSVNNAARWVLTPLQPYSLSWKRILMGVFHSQPAGRDVSSLFLCACHLLHVLRLTAIMCVTTCWISNTFKICWRPEYLAVENTMKCFILMYFVW